MREPSYKDWYECWPAVVVCNVLHLAKQSSPKQASKLAIMVHGA